MAKLHRRVPRLPHHDLKASRALVALARAAREHDEVGGAAARVRFASTSGRLALALALVFNSAAAPLAAQAGEPAIAGPSDPELARLEALAAQLEASDTRRSAYDALTTLPAESLPAIRARIEALTRGRPPENWVDDLAHRFRRRGAAAEGEERDV